MLGQMLSSAIRDPSSEELPSAVNQFVAAGFACHWLHARTKRPIGDEWSTRAVATEQDLLTSYRPGMNLGVRLGEPSKVGGGFLHALDIDIRDPDLADEAWDALRTLFDGVAIDSLPSVVSGSGGESRHLYFVTDKPFSSRKLAVSEGKHRGRDGKWHYDWEVELYGTGKQVVMPPSIHPDTGRPYRWERPFDLSLLDLGVAPVVASGRLSEIADPDQTAYEFESVEPLTFKAGQLEAELHEIPDEHIDDYQDWIALGQALHHQFGGASDGYVLWLQHSKRSEKFNEREMPSKWRSFGRNRRRPVTMATVRAWVLDARQQGFRDAFDDLPEPASGVAGPQHTSVTDLLGAPADPLDALPTAAAAAAEDVDPLDAPVKLTWVNLLDFGEKGLKSNLHNVALIVRNDPRIAGVPRLNEFTMETVQRDPIGIKPDHRENAAKPALQLEPRIWRVDDPLNGSLWSDDRDSDLRRVLEAPKTQGGYELKITDRDLKAAMSIAANGNPFHPVREYLDGLEWDGKPRTETLFVDYLGADDNAYNRDIARLILLGAVTRIFEPGHKFDFAVIIEGIQGKGKSSFIRVLGKHWFAELDGDFRDSKQLIELMQGAWIMEIPELSSFNRADVRAIKAFISRQEDRARLAYARRAGAFPRQCIFIGSTNDREYLKDDTGGRRFWPVHASVKHIELSRLGDNVDQLWAEAAALYREMRRKQPKGTLPLYLSNPASQEAAAEFQQDRRIESPESIMAGEIAAWLDRPVHSGDIGDPSEGKRRDLTCAKEVWIECFGNDGSIYAQGHSQMVGRAMALVPGWQKGGHALFKRFGKQRSFRRVPVLTRDLLH